MKRILIASVSLSILLAACGAPDTQRAEEETEESVSTEEVVEHKSIMFGDVPEEEATSYDPEEKSFSDVHEERIASRKEIMAEEYKNTRTLSEEVTLQHESVTVSITDGLISYHEVGEDADFYYGEGVVEGDMIPVMELDITLENTVEEARTLLIDQLTIVSSNGHQVDANGRLSDPPIKDMLGAVRSHGTIRIPLRGVEMWDAEYVDVFIPRLYGADYDRLVGEQSVRISFEE